MTIEQEYQMFDCTTADLDMVVSAQALRGLDAVEVAVSMLSDVQEMIAFDPLNIGLDPETLRHTLNRVKYILSQRSR